MYLPAKVQYDLSGTGGLFNYAVSALLRQSCARRIDLLFCGHLNLMPVAWALRTLCHAPILLCIHGIDAWKPTPRRVVNHLSRYPDYVLSVSEITRDRFISWSGFPFERSIILPNTIHSEDFDPGEKPKDLVERYGLVGKKVVMTFGRLAGEQREKGFDRVLEAMPQLLARDGQICYLIAGQGPDQERLEAKARTLGVRDHCVFTGYVDAARKPDIFRLADVFAMPSKGEGFGIVLLEAMACGIPVVGSKQDGTCEALRGGDLGILVNPDSLDEVADGILRAFSVPKGVPAGLSYFFFEKFRERLAKVINRVEDDIIRTD
jgi:glycosyltransferase involved in cell wall biosynthesis